MGRRNQHSREQQIEMALAAAELILVKEGYAGLSMRKIADAIGYTVGNLYLLFHNQDDLLELINQRSADAIYLHLRDAIEPLHHPAQRLQALAAAYINFAQKHSHRFRLVFELQRPEDAAQSVTSDARIRRLFELVESNLAPLLPDATPPKLRLTAATLWSGVHGVCMLAVTGKLRWGGSTRYQPLSDMLVTTFLKGLAAKSVAPRRKARQR